MPQSDLDNQCMFLLPMVLFPSYCVLQLVIYHYILLRDETVQKVSRPYPEVSLSKITRGDIQRGELLIQVGGIFFTSGKTSAQLQFDEADIAPLDDTQ